MLLCACLSVHICVCVVYVCLFVGAYVCVVYVCLVVGAYMCVWYMCVCLSVHICVCVVYVCLFVVAGLGVHAGVVSMCFCVSVSGCGCVYICLCVVGAVVCAHLRVFGVGGYICVRCMYASVCLIGVKHGRMSGCHECVLVCVCLSGCVRIVSAIVTAGTGKLRVWMCVCASRYVCVDGCGDEYLSLGGYRCVSIGISVWVEVWICVCW